LAISEVPRQLKIEMKPDAHSASIYAGAVAVGKSPHIVDPQECEDVIEPHAGFHIRGAAQWCTSCTGRESEQVGIHGWIVFVRQTAPNASECEHFAQLEPLDDQLNGIIAEMKKRKRLFSKDNPWLLRFTSQVIPKCLTSNDIKRYVSSITVIDDGSVYVNLLETGKEVFGDFVSEGGSYGA
jgi:hypothetical protein